MRLGGRSQFTFVVSHIKVMVHSRGHRPKMYLLKSNGSKSHLSKCLFSSPGGEGNSRLEFKLTKVAVLCLCSAKVANILLCPQTEQRSSTVCLPSVLCWHLKGWCGPQHLGVVPLGTKTGLSPSLTASSFGPAGSAQSSQWSFARAEEENGLCLQFEHGSADLG